MSRFLLAFFLLVASGLSQANKSEILVAAASDLMPAQSQLAEHFQQLWWNQVKFTYASSGTLAQQIQNGAPYDVYLSANESFVRNLAGSGHVIPETVAIYARGRIGLWSKSGKIRTLEALLDPGVLHLGMANPAHAPYGLAARQALERRGIWKQVEAKIVYAENVRQALQYAESGNVDAAITAWSLLFDKPGVLLPAEWHAPIRQAGAVVQSAKNPMAAREFLKFLTGKSGHAILQRFGFD